MTRLLTVAMLAALLGTPALSQTEPAASPEAGAAAASAEAEAGATAPAEEGEDDDDEAEEEEAALVTDFLMRNAADAPAPAAN